MGEGVLRSHFESISKENSVDVLFTGLLEYGQMMKTLMACDVAVNPIVGKSVSSIINKVSDYAAASLPVINTQNSEEYRQLLDVYKAGINVENGNIGAIAEAIELLYQSDSLRCEMSKNAQRLFEDRFDRQKSYSRILPEIERLLEK